ncbi:hypothetical protein ABPG72_019753 [Tetrahymena utriculariae]
MISKTSGKGPWSFDEDNKLLDWVKANGPQKWSLCSETIPGRSGKQCRERWFNNLNPNVKKGNWTAEEDDMIFQGYLQHGSSWSRIAKNLEGRTENSVKNRFYSTVRKLLSDSEKNGGKGSEQQIRNIIQMSLGKKVGGGMPSHENENDQNSDNSQCESEEDKSHNDAISSSKNNQSSEANIHKEAEGEETKKEDGSSKSQNLEGQTNKKQSKQAPSSNNNNNYMELEESKPELKRQVNETQNSDNQNLKQNTLTLADDPNQEAEGHEEETSSHAISSSQQLGLSGMIKRKYNRKRHQDEYSESNLLYRLLKSNDVTIKNTKCLQDYSVFYRKYKQNKYMMKKKKKEDDAKKQNENGDEEHTSSSMQETNQQDYNEEDEEEYDDNSHLQFQDLAAAKIKKSIKSKLGMKGGFDDKQKNNSSKDSNHKNREDSENDLDEINHQLLLLKQAKLQQQDKLKKKLKSNNQSKVEDLNQISTKIKNAKITSKTKKGHHSDEDEDSNLDHIHTNSIKEELEEDNDDDNSAQLSEANNYDDKLFNSNLPSENQLDDVGGLESQLLKFFQKSMGQFFKKFMKQNKVGGKETDKKANSKKELKKQLSQQQQQQQQQQLLQLQVQEQIQKQLEQLNNPNSKQTKNLNGQQAIQRTNTIIQNPPTKNQSKKNGSSQNPLKDSSTNNNSGIQNLIQKQIQEMQQVKQEEQQDNNDLKQKQENSKTGFKQNNTPNPQQMVSKSSIYNQKSSFQLNKNQSTPTARNGYTNQIGSSSSLFSQPNNSNYNLNNNNGGFGSLLSSHSLQMQQQNQNQNNQQLTASQNLSIQNIKNLLNQNMLGNQNSLNTNGDQGVDQKMIFLLNQLNTLESMLTNTKKELVKLEASLMNQRGSDQQIGVNQNRGGHLGNNIQGSSNNLYASNGFYNMQGGIPPTANVLKTLPSFGSRAIFEKSDIDAPTFNKRKNSKDNTSQFSDFDKFINNNN